MQVFILYPSLGLPRDPFLEVFDSQLEALEEAREVMGVAALLLFFTISFDFGAICGVKE